MGNLLALLWVLHFLMVQTAFADAPYVLSIDMLAKDGDVPSHVCVVSRGSHPAWRGTGNTPSEQEPARGPRYASLPISMFEELLVKEKRTRVLEQRGVGELTKSEVITAKDWLRVLDIVRSEPDASSAKYIASRPYIVEALEALRSRTLTGCASSEPLCEPEIHIGKAMSELVRGHDGLHLTCGPNVRRSGDHQHGVVFVLLNTFSSVHPNVLRVALDQNVASIELGGNIDEEEVFVVSVLGGHFSPGPGFSSVARRVIVELHPRCVRRILQLPHHEYNSVDMLDAILTEAGTLLAGYSCQVQDGAIDILLPSWPTQKRRRLELFDDSLAFDIAWLGGEPKAELMAKLRKVSFHWTKNCFSPFGRCPEAKLVRTGYDCRWIPSKYHCRYVCDSGGSTTPIELPETVRFIENEQSWDVQLARVGQWFAEYLDRSRRAASVQFGLSDMTDLEGVRLHVGTKYVEVEGEGVLALSGAECGETIGVEYLGSVPYGRAYQEVESGRLDLPAPMDFRSWAQPGFVRASLGLGLEWVPSAHAKRGVGTSDFASVGLRTDLLPHPEAVFVGGGVEVLIARARDPYGDGNSMSAERTGIRGHLFGALGYWGLLHWGSVALEPGLVCDILGDHQEGQVDPVLGLRLGSYLSGLYVSLVHRFVFRGLGTEVAMSEALSVELRL